MNNNYNTDDSSKSGFVSIIGSPNAGKSTLLNSILGQKISIVTHKPQTTRSSIKGILNFNSSQIIFVDTPGIFSPNTKLDNAMVNSAWRSYKDADISCFIYDSTKITLDKNNLEIINKFIKNKKKSCLIMNKIDLIDPKSLLSKVKKIISIFEFDRVFMISSTKKRGINELINWISLNLPSNPFFYDNDSISDLPSALMVSEILREKLMLFLHKEIPYNLSVDTEKWELKKDNTIKINMIINVNKKSHKTIVLGKKGVNIKNIGISARKDIEKLLGTKVHLFIFVKIKENCLEDNDYFRKWGLE